MKRSCFEILPSRLICHYFSRLKKKEFSLEEIYTNKNYKSPPPARLVLLPNKKILNKCKLIAGGEKGDERCMKAKREVYS